MLPNAFIGKTTAPTDADLTAALGDARPVWDQFLADLAREHEANTVLWKSYSPKHGWSLRVLHKKRTVVWPSPAEGAFILLFILGERAVAATAQAKLPLRIVRALAEAPRYPEGTGLRLTVKSSRDLLALLRVAAIKLAN